MDPAPAPGPRTLFAGAASRVWSGPLAVGGRLTVTTERLTFQPTGAFASMFAEQAATVALERIARAEWRSFRSRLALECTGADPLVLEGSLITRLAVCLRAMGVPTEPDDQRAARLGELLRSETAAVVTGLLRSPGWVALGQRGVFFESKGLVEHIAGVWGRGMTFGELTELRVEAGALVLEGRTGTVSIDGTSPSGWLSAVSRQAALLPLPSGVEVPELDRDGHDVLVRGEGLVQWPDEGRAVRGRYALVRDVGLVFSGLDGESEVVSTADLQRAVYGRLSEDEPDVLRVGRLTASDVLLRPRRGGDALKELRRAALAIPIEDAASMGDLGALRSLTGEVTYARITTNHRDSVSFRAGFLVQAPDGIGLVMKFGLEWPHPRGTRVRLTVGVERGVYEIDGRLLRFVEVPAEELGAGWRDGAGPQPVLFVAVPHADEVHFERTRRQDFRVLTSDGIELRSLRWVPGGGRRPWGDAKRARMIDLSASGCAVLLPYEVGVGRIFEVQVPVGGQTRGLAAEVVHVSRYTDEDTDWWRHGLRFVGQDERSHAALTREVRRRETRARYLEEGEEGLPPSPDDSLAPRPAPRRPAAAGGAPAEAPTWSRKH